MLNNRMTSESAEKEIDGRIQEEETGSIVEGNSHDCGDANVSTDDPVQMFNLYRKIFVGNLGYRVSTAIAISDGNQMNIFYISPTYKQIFI